MAHILIVDDDTSVRQLVRKVLLTGSHEVDTASDGPEALDLITRREPDLIILDLNMPVMSGYEVCHAVKDNPFTARIPVLMLTAQSDIDHKVEGFEAGADDYLSKPFEPRELLMRVVALLRLVRREGDRNPSSGLPGGQAIHAELARRAAGGEPFAICYLDLDHFKPFADAFGFTVADNFIRATAEAIMEGVRDAGGPGDFVGHIGGDDFIVITVPERAEAIARAGSTACHARARQMVGEDAARTGTFTGVDRDGRAREFPLVELSGAVLLVDPKRWISSTHLGAFAAEVKRRAKLQGDGTVVVEHL